MDECELVSLVTAVACSIGKCYSDEDIALLAAVFGELGSTLGTILANRVVIAEKNKSEINTDSPGGIDEIIL